jgi:hypothetical protein
MRTIDLTTLKETALILTFSPREKEAESAPMRTRYTRYDACSSLPLGETLAHTPVRLGPAVRAVCGV